MNLHPFINRCYVVIITLLLIAACKKTDPLSIIGNGNTGLPVIPGDTTPAVTNVGFPAGLPVTQTIGPAGGQIISSDSGMSVTIPAGALSANTDITIQPVTNECPGGFLLSYDLLPNGTKFAKPATITFRYTDDDMDGSDPMFCGVAYQDDNLQWKGDLTNRDYDTVAKTISLDISHFTPYAAFKIISIGTNLLNIYRDGQTGTLKVVAPPEDLGKYTGADDLPPLPVNQVVSGNLVQKWTVVSSDGTISPNSGNEVIYAAPVSIKTIRKIKVYALISASSIISKLGKRGTMQVVPQKVTLSKTLALVPKILNYNLKMDVKVVRSSGVFDDHYEDSESMKIHVNDQTVTVDGFARYKPTVQKTTGAEDMVRAIWVPDDIGEINITSATGNISQEPVQGSLRLIIHLDYMGTDEVFPTWTVCRDPAPCHTEGGDGIPSTAYSPYEFFVSPDELIDGKGNSAGSFEVTVTPIK